jgi:hypothetical protein
LKGKPSVTYEDSFTGKGKGAPWAKGKGKPKGNYQGLRMYPTMRPPSGAPVPHNPSSTSSSTLTNSCGKGTPSSTSTAHRRFAVIFATSLDITKTIAGNIKHYATHHHIKPGSRTRQGRNLFMFIWKTLCTLHVHVQPRHVPTCIVTDTNVTRHSLKMNFNPPRLISMITYSLLSRMLNLIVP